MKNDIVYIQVEMNGQTVYRTFTSDYLKFTDAGSIGETVQDMFDTLENANGDVFNEVNLDHAHDGNIK